MFNVLKHFQITRNLHKLMCSWRLSESALTNLMEINLWKRINFNLRMDYLKKTLQEILEKNLENSWVSRVKISHLLFSAVI